MDEPIPDTDALSTSRQFARLAMLAALVACSATCVVDRLTEGATGMAATAGWAANYASGLVILAGIGFGLAGLFGGLRQKTLDTAVIAGTGLVLNLGIVFIIVWYFAVIRPGMVGR